MEYDFLCPVSDVVHSTNPSHWVANFQVFRNSLGGFHLLDYPIQPVLRLLIQVSQVCPEFAGQEQAVVQNRLVLFQIVPMYPSLTCPWNGVLPAASGLGYSNPPRGYS